MSPGAVRTEALALTLLLLAGCSRSGEPRGARWLHQLEVPADLASDAPGGLDLVELFDLRDTHAETGRIDFGTPRSHPSLVDGWSRDEKLADLPVAWAVGTSSTLRFFLTEPRALALVLDVWGLRSPDLDRQRLSVAVNGRPLGSLLLGVNPGDTYRLPVSPSILVAGENTVTFSYAYTARPADHFASRDTRPLAACWNELRIEGTAESTPPAAHPATADRPPVLELPYGAQVDYYLDLPRGGALELAAVRGWGEGADRGALEVVLTDISGSSRTLAAATPDAERVRVALAASPEPQRLSLVALAGGEAGEGPAGVFLVAPTIRTSDAGEPPPPPPPPAEDRGGTPRPRPNVLLYVVDTLRADHLGSYGSPRDVSPHLDALARDGVLFENAVAQSSWTRPAVASILTGLYPPQHGVRGNLAVLSETVRLLPEILKDAGYETAAVVTNGTISAEFGFDRGWDRFDYLEERPGTTAFHRLSDAVNEAAIDWLDARPRRGPFFLYLHTMDPHAPYAPRPPYLERFAGEVADPSVGDLAHMRRLEREPASPGRRDDLVALYDAEIAFNDASFGALCDELRRRGLYDRTLIIAMADHGEELHEHGHWQHGRTLYRELLWIPLIVKLPGSAAAGRRIGEIVRQVDVVPTVLDMVGADVPSSLPGRSLRGAFDPGPPHLDRRPAYAHLAMDPKRQEIRAMVTPRYALIEVRQYDQDSGRQWPRITHELFDLARDPGERVNLAASESVRVGALAARLRRTWAPWAITDAGPAQVDRRLERVLKSLGYLD